MLKRTWLVLGLLGFKSLLTLPLTVCVNLGKYFKLSVPQFLHLQNRDDGGDDDDDDVDNNTTGLLYKRDITDKEFKRILRQN